MHISMIKKLVRLSIAALLFTGLVSALQAQNIETATVNLAKNQITITGYGFGTKKPPVTLGGVSLTVISYSPTQIVASLGSISAPGTYLLAVNADPYDELDVTLGVSGPQGPQGPIGLTGPQGVQGPMGLPGMTGAQGPIGLTGPAGPAGATGAVGPVGPAGPTGAAGPVGPAGPQGPIGNTGPAGPAGPAGATGATGAVGPAGPTGPQGPVFPSAATGPCVGGICLTNIVMPAGTVSRGTNFNVAFDYSQTVGQGCPGCYLFNAVEISTEASAGNGVVSGASVTCFTGEYQPANTTFQTGTENFSLTAPSSPGIYYVFLDAPRAEYYCGENGTNGAPSPTQYVGAIFVQ